MSAVEAGLSKKRPRRRDSDSTPGYLLPPFRPFQLCTLTDDIPVGSDWLFEMKFDGYRAQVAISGSKVVVYTRNGHDWTRQFKVILPPADLVVEPAPARLERPLRRVLRCWRPVSGRQASSRGNCYRPSAGRSGSVRS